MQYEVFSMSNWTKEGALSHLQPKGDTEEVLAQPFNISFE